MNEEILADKILRWFGTNPTQFSPADKWPAIIVEFSFHIALPVIFGLLIIFPFFWLWHKKKKWTLRNIGIAILQSIGLAIAGVVALYLFLSFALGQIALELYG